ncbi:hypothetical protein evm_011365 [Chilo suppressalis]|nr:hypothetical protein evm_011365 [Chilo suppressalis]
MLLSLKCTPEDSVNYINEYFCNVGEKLATKMQAVQIEPNTYPEMYPKSARSPLNSFVLLPTDEYEICKLIGSLKNSLSAGWDGIPSVFFKMGAMSLARPISHICNLCFSTGTFPAMLKRSLITPVHKAGDKTKIDNYRPISLLPTLSKILEKSITSRLVTFLENNNFFSPTQYGFRQNMSTTNAIEDVIQQIAQNLDAKKKCLAIFLDLARAFDTVSIPILLLKLENASIRGTPLKLFQSYLKERTQAVKIDNVVSDSIGLNYGVPQGSVLGPTLFLVYLNSLTIMKLQSAKIVSFADDTVILFNGQTWDEVRMLAEEGIALVLKWLKRNVLTLNLDKTKYMIFSIKDSDQPKNFSIQAHNCSDSLNCVCPALTEAINMKYLGILVDRNLNWKQQIDGLSCRIRQFDQSPLQAFTRKAVDQCFLFAHSLTWDLENFIVFRISLHLVNIVTIVESGCSEHGPEKKKRRALRKDVACSFCNGKIFARNCKQIQMCSRCVECDNIILAASIIQPDKSQDLFDDFRVDNEELTLIEESLVTADVS